MLARFRAHLEASSLISQEDKVLIGYSGGPDSTCLLCLLQETGIDVVAAHLHHGQRAEAEMEARLCESFCADRAIPFVVGNADVPLMSEELGIGLEEAGRRARYTFFDQAATRTGCSLIATAHTRTDLVETVLLNMTRGTGLAGLAGIPARRDNIIRPLLPFSREETQAFCTERGLWTHEDPANSDPSFSRARIRHRILPELRAINPRVEEAMARLAELAGAEDRFLNGMAATALENCEIKLNGELHFLASDVEVCFRRSSLGMFPAALFRRAVKLAAGSLGGNLTHEQVVAIRRGVVGSEKGSITADGGMVVVEWDAESVTLRDLAPSLPFRSPLSVPGQTDSVEFGWRIEATEERFGGQYPDRASLTTSLDKAKLKGPLYFRTAEAGDAMQPAGFKGHKKLSDLLREARLSQAARARLPIVCDMVGPVWAPGVCLDDRARSTKETKVEIRLSFARV